MHSVKIIKMHLYEMYMTLQNAVETCKYMNMQLLNSHCMFFYELEVNWYTLSNLYITHPWMRSKSCD